jgi:hypothetical protein
VKLKLTGEFSKFFMEMLRASVVCTSLHQAQVHATTTIAITVFATDAATSRPAGGNVF